MMPCIFQLSSVLRGLLQACESAKGAQNSGSATSLIPQASVIGTPGPDKN